MLTVHQAAIMALLKDFNCLRRKHVKDFMGSRFGSSRQQLSKMVNQLVVMGKVTFQEDYIMLPGLKIDHNTITAMDVMAELSGWDVDMICPGGEAYTE